MTGESADARLARHLCSRLCHDLVSPAGAVNAGLELYEEDPAHGKEALALVRRSALQMTRRLTFYRLAFGMAGGGEGRLAFADMEAAAADLLRDGTVRVVWSRDPEVPDDLPLLAGKLVLNLLLAGIDCLPRGGALEIRVVAMDEGLGVAIRAAGVGARPSADLTAALAGTIDGDALSARNVQGVLTRTLAQEVGAELEIEPEGENEVRIAAVMPAA